MQKFDLLQVGRALAALYVMLFHTGVILQWEMQGPTYPSWIAAGHSGVDFFFVLSGFIMAHVHWKDIGRPEQLSRYATNRFLRIYPVFWVVLALMVGGQILLRELEPALQTVPGVLRSMLLLPYEGRPPVQVAWTLSHEILFYLLLGVGIRFGRRGLVLLGVWWLACGIALILTLVAGTTLPFPLSFLLSPYNLLFGAGMAAALTYRHLRHLRATRACLASGLIIFTLGILWNNELVALGVSPLVYGLASTLIILGLSALESCGRLQAPPMLRFIGDASYSIYLTHNLTILVGAMLLARSGVAAFLPWTVIYVGLFGLGLLGGLIFHLLLEEPLMRHLRKLRSTPSADPARP